MAFLHDMRFRAYFYQVFAVGFVVLVGWTMFATASGNLAKQNIATGFGFLTRPAGFVITESAIAFEATERGRRPFRVTPAWSQAIGAAGFALFNLADQTGVDITAAIADHAAAVLAAAQQNAAPQDAEWPFSAR